MIDSQTRFRITKGIRAAYFLYEARKTALKRCETAVPAIKKDGTPKMRMGKPMMSRTYKCEVCGTEGHKIGTPTKPGFQIDHISPVGGAPGSRDTPKWWSWDIYISRMFCNAENFQGICRDCHVSKTLKDKADMRSGIFYKRLREKYFPEG